MRAGPLLSTALHALKATWFVAVPIWACFTAFVLVVTWQTPETLRSISLLFWVGSPLVFLAPYLSELRPSVFIAFRTLQRRRCGECEKCGYHLTGLPLRSLCPECGHSRHSR